VKENIVIDKSKFDAISVVFDPRANKRDSLYWVNIRSSPLSIKDKKTYFTYDTLRTNKGFSIEKFMNLYKWSALGYVPIGPFDFQLNKLFKFNDYEKLRIGFGITTNKSISKKFKLSSYLGWGVEDNALKFGGDVTIFPTQNVTTTFRLFYDQDVVESASPKIAYQAGTFIFNNETFRDFAVSRMDSINAFGLEFNFKPSIFLWSSVSITSKIVNPTYDYLYTISDESSSEFKATETALLFYYAFGRKMIQLGNDFVFTRPQYPLFKFKITQAIPATFNDKFKYSKFEFDLFNSFNSPLGTTSTNITGGLLINEAPYPLLFNGKGFNSDNYATFFYLYSNFQTMGLTEFISDRYVNIFLQQNFGNILNIPKINFFKPSFSLTYSGGIGNLKNKSSHSGISFKTMEMGYHESGIILDNLIRLKYLRTLYVGFGVGAFYRYGYYEFSTPSDNVAIKASIKIGF
jgi:hypothetical protein